MIDPRSRLAGVACAGVFAITLDRPHSLLVLSLLCTAALVRARPPRAWLLSGLWLAAAVIWGTVLSQGLFYAEQPRVALLSLGPLRIWREGLQHGLVQSLRLVAMAFAGAALTLSTPPDRLHAALLRLQLPFGLALMASTALRLVPELAGELAVVRAARAARGAPPPWIRVHRRAAAELALLRPVVARSWRRAVNLAESLDARGFDAVGQRSARRPLRASPLDWLIMSAAAAFSLLALTLRMIFWLYSNDIAWHPSLRPLYSFVRQWM